MSSDILGAVSARTLNIKKSRVVISRDSSLRAAGGSIDPDRMLAALDRAVQSVFDKDDPVEAWKKVVNPGEVVGLKVNCISGLGNSASVALVEAVSERLGQAGIAAKDIVIWDRLNTDLERGGFKISLKGRGTRCYGNDALGFEQSLCTHGSAASLLCKTLTRVCDCVINLPVLKDHGIVGVTASMKNMFGAIHNPNKYHMSVGDPYVADVNMFSEFRRKIRLNICDATTVQYEGGPSYFPHWTWAYNGLIAGLDPVALDHVGWKLIEQKRAEEKMKTLKELNREPTYIHTAADRRHRLGTNDPSRIELVEL